MMTGMQNIQSWGTTDETNGKNRKGVHLPMAYLHMRFQPAKTPFRKKRVLIKIQSSCVAVSSVARFDEISPLWQNILSFCVG